MNIIDVIHEQEADIAFLLREELNEMTDLERSTVLQLQDEALAAYERVEGVEAMQCSQAAMLAQIALELAQINTLLEHITKRVEES